jgi:hypothetical protein
MQTTSHLLMIRPVNFTFNPETAVNNAFQSTATADAQQQARREFDEIVRLLRNSGVDVTVIDDIPEPYTPDSIFPNNWISFHENGLVCLYPMYAANRRLERKPDVLERLGKIFRIERIIDLTAYEKLGRFLEGTGSMVLDRDNKIAYACLSPRTDEIVLRDFCSQTGYTPEIFNAVDANSQPIYHTNVMMCVADRYVVACADSILEPRERAHFIQTIQSSGKELIPITVDQMNHFAGNMLQVHTHWGERLLVMSSEACNSLTTDQISHLISFNVILHSDLNAIETNGGGSARCMMAEIHLEPR